MKTSGPAHISKYSQSGEERVTGPERQPEVTGADLQAPQSCIFSHGSCLESRLKHPTSSPCVYASQKSAPQQDPLLILGPCIHVPFTTEDAA